MFTVLRLAVIGYPKLNPVALDFGLVKIRWYGLSYVAGLLLGWMYIRRLVADAGLWGGRKTPTLDQVDRLLLWVLAGVVLGGRLGEVLLYHPEHYLKDPLEILRTWNGGMSFHGGLIGVALALYLFSRRHGLRFLTLGDLVATAVPLGLFFGRIANFVNGELWGRTTDVPWAMVFPDPQAGPLPRHPSQLYEAGLEGLVLGAVLWWLATRRGALRREGLAAGVFLVGYGVTRGVCEMFREPDSTWFYQSVFLTSGMLYCIPMILVGAWLIRRALAQPQASPA